MRIYEEVAAVINQNKEDFYNKYDYLEPNAEKYFLEICFDSAAYLPMLLSGLKAALASGAITGGINAGISLASSRVQDEDIGTIIGNSLNNRICET